ncbi:MAG TPA: membrane protein insertase YidC, partial [Elusimicrobiota bacterium]|nr:membrane protein insertase YidC [Elusimicrobiota bacterium]
MSKNLALAILLSFGILFAWDALVMRPRRQQMAPAAASPSTPQTVSPPPAVGPAPATTAAPERLRLVEYLVGRQRVAFNLFGGGVNQWTFEEKDRSWIPLLPDTGVAYRPFQVFPELEYTADSPRTGTVRLSAERSDGLQVEKSFRISSQTYIHEMALTLKNRSKEPLTVSYDIGWGPGLESGDTDPKEKIRSQRALAFEAPRLHKIKEGTRTVPARWWGLDARYFLAAFLSRGQNVHVSVDKINDHFVVKKSTTVELPPGASFSETLPFYLGPKGYAQLASLREGLERSVDFGFFGGLGRIVLRILYYFHRLTHNYGWAIILLTLMVQILTIPLTIHSFHHSQKMKAIQPQMKKIQELFKSDPKRLNAEMLNLYQRHGLKFMGMEGCFPILVQLPVFWALYTTLRNAYELRGAPWIFWVRDLSVHDPFYIL